MISRRDICKIVGMATVGLIGPVTPFSVERPRFRFQYCLNTSTIRGQIKELPKILDTASRAGYDSVELWISEIRDYLLAGNSITRLKQIINDNKLKVANAIGFAPWMVDDDDQSREGFQQMEEEMNLLAEINCPRVAAPASGVATDKPLDLLKAGDRYRQLLDLGRKTGVMPQLEFWGSSKVFYHLGQALMVLASANDPDGRLLADVYHLFRGGSGFEGLKLINGDIVEIFHMNDYRLSKAREQQTDADRIFPGMGDAPLHGILAGLKRMGGTKILSLELFNRDYWKQDALSVAKTGIDSMKRLVAETDKDFMD